MAVDTVGPWSRDKLELLRKYLEAYTTILAAQERFRDRYHYVDAFAGAGRPLARDTQQLVDGSPRVALQVSKPFSSYRFIEQASWHVAQLEALRAEFPNRRIIVDRGDCNAVLVEKVAPAIRYERYNRGLVFLDPFSMSVEWATVEVLSQTRALELFINVPAMAINRTVLVSDPEQLSPDKVTRMDRFWGSNAWQDSIYQTVPTLFGEQLVKVPQRGKALGRLYRDRLRQAFPYVSEPIVMANHKGAPLYHLVFAGHNATGSKIVGEIFDRFERLGK